MKPGRGKGSTTGRIRYTLGTDGLGRPVRREETGGSLGTGLHGTGIPMDTGPASCDAFAQQRPPSPRRPGSPAALGRAQDSL